MQIIKGDEQICATSPRIKREFQDIVTCIKSGTYDYIGVAITPWHARMAVASYLKLRSNNQIDSGILLIDRHNKDGFLLSAEMSVPGLHVAYLERCDGGIMSMVQSFACRLLLPLFQSKMNKGRLVFLANPSFPGSIFESIAALGIGCRLSYILLDEGVGSYLSTSEDWVRQSIEDRGLHGVSARIRGWLSDYEQRELPKLIHCLNKKDRFEKFYLFDESGNLNTENAAFVKKSFESSDGRTERSTHLFNSKYENALVFCSQFPLVEAGSISLEAHCQAVDVAYQASRQLGVPLVIKLHPREKDLSIYDGVDAYIDSRHGVALEEILGDLSKLPLCIASLCSTAMISSSAVFDCCGISLSALISSNETTDGFSVFCKKMNSLFGSYYKTPSTIEDLCSFLEEKC